MIRVLLFCGVIALLPLLIQWFIRSTPAAVKKAFKHFILFSAVLGLIALTASGRMGWVVPLLGGLAAMLFRLLPHLLRLAPVFQRLWLQYQANRARSQSGKVSSVETDFLLMTLDHDHGEINGQILKGSFKGRMLSELALKDLLELREEMINQDRDSLQLIESYLDRIYPNQWRQSRSSENHHQQYHWGPDGSQMSREEALEILGLAPGSSTREIIAAHRRLIQKIHPDRGGSGYLASKINQARDVLLG